MYSKKHYVVEFFRDLTVVFFDTNTDHQYITVVLVAESNVQNIAIRTPISKLYNIVRYISSN